MNRPVLYLTLKSTDPAWNLAAEQHLFETLPPGSALCMLWQNENAVIIGKYQNMFAEINEEAVSRRGVRVVRRLSGGGAVYHDSGNLNYTLIGDAGNPEKLDFRVFSAPVIRALEGMGIRAELTGRNDLTVQGRKISGNAQYVRAGRVMHHGTLLFDSDLSVMEEVLAVDPGKVRSKGISSVRSRVTNIRPLLPEDLRETVRMEEFRARILSGLLRDRPGEELVLSEQDLLEIERLKRERYDSWSWNCGASPPCSIRKKRRIEGCGTLELFLRVEEGKIVSAKLCGDFFAAEDPEKLTDRLTGLDMRREALRGAAGGRDPGEVILGLTEEEYLALLSS